MDVYIVDTVAFLAYLANTLPPKADSKFKDAEMKKIKLLLPTIALGETLYTIYKGKEIFGKAVPLEKVEFIFNVLEVEETIQLVDMNIDAWRIFHGLFQQRRNRCRAAFNKGIVSKQCKFSRNTDARCLETRK